MEWFLLAAGVIAALLFLLFYICYSLAFKVDRKKAAELFDLPHEDQYDRCRERVTAMIADAAAFEYKDVYTTSFDGLKLHGKLYITDEDAPFQLMFHGYMSNGMKDFSGGLRMSLERGNNAIVVDQRAHGLSEGRCLAFGILERHDVLSWIDYVKKEYGEDREILLYGVSMGAATVLMASGEDLPENVKAIVADCGYSSPRDIIRKVVGEDMRLPVFLAYPAVRMGARIFGGFDLEETDAVHALAKTDIPVFIVHGEDDRFVPCYMSYANFEACASEKKILLTVPGAGHALSYVVDKERYTEKLNGFLADLK